MFVTETTRYSPKQKKSFAWSYSKLKNFEACPKRHYHVDLKKDFREADSTQLLWGNAVHKSLAQRISQGTILPPLHQEYEPWAKKVLHGPGEISVEQDLAINKDFQPCEWFGKDAWLRVKIDVAKLNGPVGLLIDWKTGKIVEDSVQLALSAAVAFSHYPQLQAIRTMYVWLKEDAETKIMIKRSDLPTLWNNLWDRIENLKTAHETDNYPPTPNRLCRSWCPVKVCPHHGESHG